MRASFLIALVVAAYAPAASACSIDALKKIAADHLDRLPSGAQHDFVDPDEPQTGGTWQVFEGESGTPHSVVVAWLGESGQTKFKFSFLNRRDFVITEMRIDYDEILARNGRFKVRAPRYYFFCDGELQDSAEITTEMRDRANHEKKRLFESTGLLKQEIDRVPK